MFNFIKYLFQPKWKSHVPEIRIEGLLKLKDFDYLKPLATSDPSPKVREMAQKRIEEIEVSIFNDFILNDRYVGNFWVLRDFNFITNENFIDRLVEEAKSPGIKELALEKCRNSKLVDKLCDYSGNFHFSLLAIYQKWLLDECLLNYGACCPLDVIKWLSSGRSIAKEHREGFAKCTRAFRSIKVIGRSQSKSTSGDPRVLTTTTTTNTTSFDLSDIEDHFIYDENNKNISKSTMKKKAKLDRKKTGKVWHDLEIIEHKDFNKWLVSLIQYDHLIKDDKYVKDTRKENIRYDDNGLARLSVMPMLICLTPHKQNLLRAQKWLSHNFVPLSYFLSFREKNEKEAVLHYSKNN